LLCGQGGETLIVGFGKEAVLSERDANRCSNTAIYAIKGKPN